MAVTIKKTPGKPGPKGNKQHNWEAVFRDFMKRNLSLTEKKAYNLPECAKHWKIPYEAVRAKAKEEEWYAKLKAEKAKMTSTALMRISAAVVDSEVEMQRTLLRTGFVMIEKGLMAVQHINAKKLSAKDATGMMNVGSQVIDRVLRWKKDAPPPPPEVVGDDIAKERAEFERRMALRGRVGEALAEAYRVIEGSFTVVKQ